tara:strand:+ start:1869 stop:4205 length:2337 start_codon:yes stop_codon:yes gene_type:complete
MATLEELEQLKLAEQGNQEIRDTQRVQDYFNAYKSQGSFLMEKGQITEEQYFGRVRDMGVKLELIGAEEYPDEINEYVKPVMSITGATIGGIVGAGLAPVTGGMSLLIGSSIGAAVGAGVSEVAYRGVQELSAPDALPLRDMEELASSVGKEAGVTGVLSFGIGGVLMNAGRAASAARSASAKSVDRWTKVDPNKKQKVLSFVDKAKLKVQSYYVQPEMFRQQVATMAKEQGITLPNSVVASPLLKSLAEAFAKTPLLGAPARASFEKVRTDVINRVIKGTKNGETPEQSINAFLSNYKIATTGDDIGKIVSKSGGRASSKTEELALTATLNAVKNAKTLNEKVLNSQSQINSILKSEVFKKKNVLLAGFSNNLTQASSRGDLGGQGISSISKFLKKAMKDGNISGKNLEILKQKMDDAYLTYSNKALATNAVSASQKQAFNKLYSNFYDDIGRSVTNKTGYNQATQSLSRNLNTQDRFLRKAEDSGVLNTFNSYVRELKGARSSDFTKAVHDDMGYKIVDDVGQVKPFPGLNSETITAGMKNAANKDASAAKLVEKVQSARLKDHKELKNVIGNKAYNRLAKNEMDAKFEKTFIAAMNGADGKTLQSFTKMLKDDKQSIQNILKNGNFNYTFKDLETFAKLVPYLPSQPALNQFVQRNMMLNLANGGNIAALGSVTGMSMLGGGTGAVAGMGGLWIFNKIMAKPYVQGALKKAAKAKGQEQVAQFQAIVQQMNSYVAPFLKGQEKVFKENPQLKQYLNEGGLQFLNENIMPDFSGRN